METGDIKPQLEQLSDDIGDLEEALAPLLDSNSSTLSSKLPLLDKAKLHVLTTYAIESIVFSVLKLNNVDARQHAVFTELARVKQYFAKIQQAEKADGGQEMKRDDGLSLNREAAGRVVKHALAGNNERPKEGRAKVEKAEPQLSTSNKKKRKKTTSDRARISEEHVQQQRQDDEDVDAEGLPVETSSDVQPGGEGKKRKRDKEKSNRSHRKQKSDKPPKDTKTVFQDLLHRGRKP